MPLRAENNPFPSVLFAESAAPSTPAAGTARLYVKSDGLLYWKDDAGTETAVGVGSVAAHLADTTDAHDASAVSFSPTGTIAATDVQAAIAEVATEAASPTFTDYTPALTASTTSPTLGAGSNAVGRYCQVGKLVTGWASIAFGTSGVAAGSGTYRVSLPVAAAAATGACIGATSLRDDSTGARQPGAARLASTTYVELTSAAAAVTNAVPWTWAASDSILVDFTYEAA